MLERFKGLLPKDWLGQTAPVADALIGGICDSLDAVHDLYLYARDQTRIETASGFMLDLIAWDFLGGRLRRRDGQTDDAFREAILKEIFRPRASRPAMALALKDLTGVEPIIFEPANVNDTGAWGVAGMGWCAAGRWGSIANPYECWIDVQRPLGEGIEGANGWGDDSGGWGYLLAEWVSLSMAKGPVTDDDIYDCIERTRPAGVRCWTRIADQIPPPDLQPSYGYLLDAQGNRLVLDDGGGLLVSWPAETNTSAVPPDTPLGRLWFNDKTMSGLIAALPF